MKPMNAEQIKGNWVSLFLKVMPDEGIDYDALEALIDYYIKCGVDGIYTNGTAAEFYTQSFEEYKRISSIVAEKCEKAGMPFQIGASHMSPQESLRRVEYAASLKPSAIQIILPDWFPASRRTQISFLEKIVDAASGIGIVLYNPPHAKVVLAPKDYREILHATHGIIGIKTAGGNADWYDEMQDIFPKVSVFIPGHFLATGVMRGAKGAYSNMAALNPKAAQMWYDMTQNDLPGALELEKRICKFIEEDIVPFITEFNYSSQACDKFMAVVGGWCDMTTKLRWPYFGIDEDEVEKVRASAKKKIPEFFQ